MSMVEVSHDPAGHRFSAVVDGERAVLDYTISGEIMTITHTGVPRRIEGRGIAAELMRHAVQTARERGWKIVPACSYAAAYLATHPAEGGGGGAAERHQSDLLDEALDESFPASDPPAVGNIDR
jgi:predicted GNAT family acetyltransferase